MKTLTRMLALSMALLLCLSGAALADTSILTESGFPIVKEPVTLTMYGNMSAIQPEFKDMYILQKYEELTGVHIEWTSIPSSARNEK